MLTKIKRQLTYIFQNSLFYQKKFKGHKNIGTLKDFSKLPLTTKVDLLSDQEKCPPFGNNICVGNKDIVRIHKTSGTTDRPVMIAMTKNDIKVTIEVGAKCFKLSGLRKDDLVVHCLNYNMWAGGYTDHQSLEKAGAAVVPFGVGNSQSLIETILHLKATAIHCTPSYLSKLEFVIKDKFHLKPKDLNLRLGLFGGESGLQNQDFRQNIERVWGLKAMNANYGMSEVLSIVGAECTYQNGLHFMGEGSLYPELIDHQSSKSLALMEGAVGELVLTNLEKEAQPLVRYRTGDIIRILGQQCPCGQRSFRFEIIGRSDNMLVIRGLNFFVSSIDFVINQYLQDLTGVYQIFVNKTDPIDRILLKLEARDHAQGQQVEKLKDRILEDFQAKFTLKPEIQFVNTGALSHFENKIKKLHREL